MTASSRERIDPSLLDWLRIIRDGWRVLAILVLAGGLVGLAATAAQPTRYRTTGSILVTPRTFLDPSAAPHLPILTATVEQLTGTTAILKPAASLFVELARTPEERAARRSLATLKWLESHVQVAQTPNSSIIEISAIAPSQSTASDLTVALVRTLARVINDQSGPGQSTASGTDGVRLKIFTLQEPRGRLTPTPVKNVFIGLNAGFILGLLGAFAFGPARRRLYGPDEIATALGISTGAVFMVADSTRPEDPGLLDASAYLQDGARIDDEGTAEIVLITGTIAATQLVSVGTSLADALRNSDAWPMLVDADFHEHASSLTRELTDRPRLLEVSTTGIDARRDPQIVEQARDATIALVAGPRVDDTTALVPLLRAANRVVFVTKRGVPARSLESARLVTRKPTAVLVLR